MRRAIQPPALKRATVEQSLPLVDDIMSIIIGYSSPKELAMLEKTCKQYVNGHWWDFVSHISLVNLSGVHAEYAILRLSEHHSRLRALHIEPDPAAILREQELLQRVGSQLTEFGLGPRCSWSCWNLLSHLEPNKLEVLCLKLSSVPPQPDAIVSFISRATQLKELDWGYSSNYLPGILSEGRHTKLEKLTVSGMYTDSNTLVKSVLSIANSKRDHLHRLELTFVGDQKQAFSGLLGLQMDTPSPTSVYEEACKQRLGMQLGSLLVGGTLWEYWIQAQLTPNVSVDVLEDLFDACHKGRAALDCLSKYYHRAATVAVFAEQRWRKFVDSHDMENDSNLKCACNLFNCFNHNLSKNASYILQRNKQAFRHFTSPVLLKEYIQTPDLFASVMGAPLLSNINAVRQLYSFQQHKKLMECLRASKNLATIGAYNGISLSQPLVNVVLDCLVGRSREEWIDAACMVMRHIRRYGEKCHIAALREYLNVAHSAMNKILKTPRLYMLLLLCFLHDSIGFDRAARRLLDTSRTTSAWEKFGLALDTRDDFNPSAEEETLLAERTWRLCIKVSATAYRAKGHVAYLRKYFPTRPRFVEDLRYGRDLNDPVFALSALSATTWANIINQAL